MAGETAAAAKKEREEKSVVMKDGRTQVFVGKRKLLKDIVIDETKVTTVDDKITLGVGAVAVRLDFINGETRLWTPPLQIVARACGHGLSQKLGDEVAGTSDVEDQVIAIDSLMEHLDKGDWTRQSEGGGFSGASVVVRALMEASGKTQEQVKTFLDGLLEAAKAKGEKLSRIDLYKSFRKPGTKVGDIVARLEKEKGEKEIKVDSEAAFAALIAS